MKPISVAPVEDGLFHPGDIRFSLAAMKESGALFLNNRLRAWRSNLFSSLYTQVSKNIIILVS